MDFKKLFFITLSIAAGVSVPLLGLDQKTPSDSDMAARAQRFVDLGLLSIAREQYRFLALSHPKDKRIKAQFEALSDVEAQTHYKNALEAHQAGALNLAHAELEKAIDANPRHQHASLMKKRIQKEIELKKNLSDRLSSDYLKGLADYEAGRYDRALENFVKVLNMDPQHKGALSYVERLGQKMAVSQ